MSDTETFDVENFEKRCIDDALPVSHDELKLLISLLKKYEKECHELRAAYLAVEEENDRYHGRFQQHERDISKKFGPQNEGEIVTFATVRQSVDREIAIMRVERELKAHNVSSIELYAHSATLIRRNERKDRRITADGLLEAMDTLANAPKL